MAAADGGGFSGFFADLARRSRTPRDVAEDIGRRVSDEMHGRRTASDTQTELARLWRRIEALVEDRAGPATSRIARSASEYAGEGRDLAHDAADWVRDVTRARPLLAIGITVAATLAVASLLGAFGRSGPREK